MLTIKPHHFVDILTALGEGRREYAPHPYGHALHSVAATILANPDVTLQIELGADDICHPCRHNIGNRCDDTIDTSYRPNAPASKQDWNLRIDRRWCQRLALAQGNRLTARQLCQRIRERAGDIADIYREIPEDRTAQRQAKLEMGIAMY
ncbi:MAG: hypothetical protein JXR77_13520 [Lentisphaeria bacterium]|nr:hypothetical protein [Lentisphaeria bacterium]